MARPKPVSASGFGSAVEKAIKGEGGASLLLVDLDNLMVLNEKAGRDVGDKAIRTAMRVLDARAHAEGWTCGRIGGGEVALLAPRLPLAAPLLSPGRVRGELAAAPRQSAPPKISVTTSAGGA